MNCFARLALAFALLGAAPASAAESCAESLSPACLQTLGAGVRSTSADEQVDCPERLKAYRDCIAALVVQRGPAAASIAPLSRAERGFLSALEAELADNVGRLDAFAEAMDLTGETALYENDWPQLRLRFFNATDNPAYFVAPADWLARVQGFYDDVARLLADEQIRHAYRRQVTSVLYERRLARERLQALVATGRDALLPEISAELAESR